MFPTREKAFELLYDAEKSNPGPWIKHSVCVAECAEKIAERCGLDPSKAFVLGLLHDIGRKFGVTAFAHITDGYAYMLGLGYEEVARICLTHSFSNQCIEDGIVQIDIPEEKYAHFEKLVNEIEFTDYDKLIQLCDSLAGVEIVEMNERMDDVAHRYGSYPDRKRKENLNLKKYFEQKAGANIYTIVTENQALWGL